MHPTFAAILADPASVAEEEESRLLARAAARVAWVRRTSAAIRDAQHRADAAWMRLIDAHPDDAEDLPDPPEQAELDALWAQMKAVADHDRWPRHLYFTI
jgi:hypothetical protein